MSAPKNLALALLSLFGLLASRALATLPFGHYGPEGTVLFLNGFHFVSGHSDWEISANHYCVIVSDALLQCAIYNTATSPAHLAGIEYIITEEAFSTLDFEERQLWHSHVYEVKSGFLIEPGMPASVDHVIMGDVLISTYGKTFHTWRYDQRESALPVGIPELVMGYTHNDQITPDFVVARDDMFGVNTSDIRASRADIPSPAVQEGADSWKYGFVLTLGLVNTTANTTFGSGSSSSSSSASSAGPSPTLCRRRSTASASTSHESGLLSRLFSSLFFLPWGGNRGVTGGDGDGGIFGGGESGSRLSLSGVAETASCSVSSTTTSILSTEDADNADADAGTGTGNDDGMMSGWREWMTGGGGMSMRIQEKKKKKASIIR